MYIKRSILKKYQILLNVSLTGVVVPQTIIEYISQFTIAIVYFTDFLENLTTFSIIHFSLYTIHNFRTINKQTISIRHLSQNKFFKILFYTSIIFYQFSSIRHCFFCKLSYRVHKTILLISLIHQSSNSDAHINHSLNAHINRAIFSQNIKNQRSSIKII